MELRFSLKPLNSSVIALAKENLSAKSHNHGKIYKTNLIFKSKQIGMPIKKRHPKTECI